MRTGDCAQRWSKAWNFRMRAKGTEGSGRLAMAEGQSLEAERLSETGGPHRDHGRELGKKSQLFLSLDAAFV